MKEIRASGRNAGAIVSNEPNREPNTEADPQSGAAPEVEANGPSTEERSSSPETGSDSSADEAPAQAEPATEVERDPSSSGPSEGEAIAGETAPAGSGDETPEAREAEAADDAPASESSAEAKDEPSKGKDAPREKGGGPRKIKDPALARAFRSRRPVEGKIVEVIKGGYEVRIGRSRAFCPHSQIDPVQIDKPEEMVGKTFLFRIHQFRRGGEDVVLSRRALLEEEMAEEQSAVRATLIEGAVMQGHVSGVTDFGAFVDLGAGVQGLVHISELSHGRLRRVQDAVSVGDTVQVKVLKIDGKRGRISLSMRSAQDDPWKDATERFEVGKVYPGTVLRLADFGAFVEMAPGVEALAPAREFPPAPGDWREGLDPGTQRDWVVLSVDPRQRRMSLVPEVEGVPYDPDAVQAGKTVNGKVQKVERFGVFVWLGPGKVGLMPVVWSGVPQGQRLDSRFRAGQDVEVRVVDISEGGRRIRLAAPGVEADPDEVRGGRKPDREAAKRAAEMSANGQFGTSLGDVLRAALDRDKDA